MATSSPNTARIEESLEVVRQSINAATVNLASSHLLNDEATESLLWVLQTTLRQAHEAMQDSDVPWSESGTVDDDIETSTLGQADKWSDENHIRTRNLQLQGTAVQRENPVVFSHPFVLAPRGNSFQTLVEAQSYLAAFSAVAIFNVALAKHTQFYDKTRSAQERSRLIQEATAFYHQAYELIDLIPDLSPEGTLVNVYLASCNNLAEVYLARASPQQSKEWQDVLDATLFAVPPAERSPVYRHLANANLSYMMDLRSVEDL